MSLRTDLDSGSVLVHETWGDHAALLARSTQGEEGSVGLVESRVLDVATPADPLRLQHGGVLERVAVAYETYGELNAEGTNAVLITHALTGSGHAAGVTDRESIPGWWDPLIGPGKPIDTSRFFVISSNVLGGCYGTTGPSSLSPEDGRPYGPRFPRYTVRDMVNVQKRLVDALGVRSLRAVIGGSMGGMQVLEWAASYPELVRGIVPIAIGARHSAWAIGLNEVARRAIMGDPAWQGGHYSLERQPETGLGLARAIAMLSYRSFDSLEAKFGRDRRAVAEPVRRERPLLPTDSDWWVFGYGSLMWNPGFPHHEAQMGLLRGYHRRFCIYSFRYRGTPEAPGLVLGLDRGGSCLGMAFRVPQDLSGEVMAYLRERELEERAGDASPLLLLGRRRPTGWARGPNG